MSARALPIIIAGVDRAPYSREAQGERTLTASWHIKRDPAAKLR